MCVSAPKAINYIHSCDIEPVQLVNKFVRFRNVMKQFYAWAWPVVAVLVLALTGPRTKSGSSFWSSQTKKAA